MREEPNPTSNEASGDAGGGCSDGPETVPEGGTRRAFFKKALTMLLGAVAAIGAIIPAVMVLIDPLRRRQKDTNFVRITTRETLPENGEPRKFTVIKDSTDAWNRYPQKPVGAVYLRRGKDKSVEAFNANCPHANCFVAYRSGENFYRCPCHNSSFTLDGSIRNADSPSPRGLDSLEVEIRNQNEVWVKFQNFRAGTPKKIPLS